MPIMPQILAKPRNELGKKAKTLRREGILPAVLYGEGVPSQPLSVMLREFRKVLSEAGETSLITLKIEGAKDAEVLIHDIATDPVTLEPVHADFYAVRMDKPIEAKVVLSFDGESPAVKNEGGILVKVLHELEVRALPRDLPHEIAVDVARLEAIGSKIHVKDVALPKGVATLAEPDEVVALVEPPRSEAELEELSKVAQEEGVAEVKTEREEEVELKAKAESEAEQAEK